MDWKGDLCVVQDTEMTGSTRICHLLGQTGILTITLMTTGGKYTQKESEYTSLPIFINDLG